MLFQRRFHAGIRNGSVKATIRAWKTPRVKVGQSYRIGPRDTVRVESVEALPLSAVTTADARRSGFGSRDELVEAVRQTSRTRLTARSKVFRVVFRHAGSEDPRPARGRDTSAAALDEVIARLERMERRGRGPWTRAVLELVERHPRTAASQLAPRVQRETRAFKADVRKLKELGLTESHEVGYALTARGRALLARLRRRA